MKKIFIILSACLNTLIFNDIHAQNTDVRIDHWSFWGIPADTIQQDTVGKYYDILIKVTNLGPVGVYHDSSLVKIRFNETDSVLGIPSSNNFIYSGQSDSVSFTFYYKFENIGHLSPHLTITFLHDTNNVNDTLSKSIYVASPPKPDIRIDDWYFIGDQGLSHPLDTIQQDTTLENHDILIKFTNLGSANALYDGSTPIKIKFGESDSVIGFSNGSGIIYSGQTDSNMFTFSYKFDKIGYSLLHLTISFPNDTNSSNDTLSRPIFVTPSVFPKICVVTVDEETGYNTVIWNKDQQYVNSYKLYKENSVGNYVVVSEKGKNELSVYVDSGSNPLQKAYSYKMSIVDTFGVESPLSSLHKTMHLTINSGQNNSWNLIWTPYQGFGFNTAYIMRGASLNNMIIIDSVSSSTTSFTDLTPPPGDLIYQIALTNPGGCNPTAKTTAYEMVKSNIAETNPTGIKIKDYSLSEMVITPNPGNNQSVLIRFNNENNSTHTIKAVNLLGKEVWTKTTNSNQVYWQESALLVSGVYFISLQENGKILSTKKIIIQ